jgi:hypothetical protein
MLKHEDVAEFTWSFGMLFLLETPNGNYEWDDPDYGGDNTIKPYHGTYENWIEENHIPFGRSKGEHVILDYCGPEVRILEEEQGEKE